VEIRRVPEVWPLLERQDHPLAADLLRSVHLGSPASFETTGVLTSGAREAALGGSQTEEGSSIRIYMFGPARVLVGSAPVNRWKKPAARDLLLYLVH
jgi:hypothetical protein